jgi:vancomycin aglycone glucosyltransferase
MGRGIQDFMNEHAGLMHRPFKVMGAVRDLLQGNLEEEFQVLGQIAAEADVVVGATLIASGPSVAEQSGIPFVHLAFVPGVLPGPHRAPFTVQRSRLPWLLNGLAWWGTFKLFDRFILGLLNTHREKMGLIPVKSVVPHILADRIVFAGDEPLIDPTEFSEVGKDGARVVPALVYENPAALTEETAALFKDNAPLVYVGFGSMVSKDPLGLMHRVVEALALAEVGGIVSKGWAALDNELIDASHVATIGPENHAALFPRCAAIVHHGGAGTTSTALRAGVPQVVVAFGMDQYDWGNRVARSGVGPGRLSDAGLRPRELARAIRQCLDDEAMKSRAAQAGAALSQRRGNEAAADLLERLVADGEW